MQDVLDHRSFLAHTYDFDTFKKAAPAIRDRYHPAIEDLHAWFLERSLD